jgi:predicted transcriptional regulator YdeE
MEPRIIESGQMILVGFSFFGDPFQLSAGWTEENEIGRLWSRFMAYVVEHGDRIKRIRDQGAMYELHVYYEETPRTGEFEVFVGLEVGAVEDLPLELSVKFLPPTTYAVFTLQGEQITSDWPILILTDWLPEAGYESDFAYHLQRYDERFKGLDRVEESALDVYIPVERLPSAG